MTTIRQKRLAEMLFEELNSMISLEVSDPRLFGISVTAVEISPDLRYAKVYFIDESGLSIEESMAGLEHAESFFRRELAVRLSLRYVPELHFHEDRLEEHARRIDVLLDQIKEEAKKQNDEQN